MFLLIGSRAYATVLFMVTFVCGNCGVAAPQRIMRLQQRLTLFFIPLFSYGTSYVVECDHCGIETGLTKKQAEHSLTWASTHEVVTP